MAGPGEPILTTAQMRAAEAGLIARGETVDSLMLRAGRGAAEWVWRLSGGRPVTILCGPGNNGGDGYVIAETLRRRGADICVVAPLPPASEAARRARGNYFGPFGDGGSGEVLVDCLFGSGLSRALDERLADLLRNLAAAHRRVVAVDVPSGVDSDGARPLNDGLPDYDLTLALGAWKYAHWLMPAMAGMGERRLVPIGTIEAEANGTPDGAWLIGRPRLSPPSRDAHKYSRGLLAVIGGIMPGAAMLAVRAAVRGGAGYVKLLASERTVAAPDELVVDERALGDALADDRIDALLIGPGLGRTGESRAKLETALARNLPTVCDGDGLMLLNRDMLKTRTAPLILTPHAGELQRLEAAFGVAEGDRLQRVRSLASSAGAVVVAKGPDSMVAAPAGEMAIAPPAPSWLSAAGTGDVLAGLIASRLATGCAPMEAACQAVWLHGEAARQCGPAFSASELAHAIADAYAACL